jgi:hypothetical protein
MLRRLAGRVLDLIADRVTSRLASRIGSPAAEQARLLTGSLCAARVRGLQRVASLAEAEFQVYSQWGEDGILQYLLARVAPRSRSFVEFGVQSYTESNTRFLLVHDNWSGLVIDSSQEFIDFIRGDAISWRHDLTALCAFITRDNINDLIAQRFAGEDLGLLSVDIDGNDYWVWQAVNRVKPEIVVCEYNSVFGPKLAVSVPYSADFYRTQAHHSNLYFGASLAALCRLGEEKGYAFVGSNSAGNNAFFVRRDHLSGVAAHTAKEGYVESKFRESRDTAGQLNYLSGIERLRAIQDLPLVEVASGATRPIRELYADVLSARG